MKALGFVEVTGVVAAIDALDIMCKTASVSLVSWERKLGGRLVTIIVEGSVSDVTEAIENAKAKCVSEVKAANVIANPHSETQRLVALSASRLNKNKAEEKKPEPIRKVEEVPTQTNSVKEEAPQPAKKTTAKKAKTTAKK